MAFLVCFAFYSVELCQFDWENTAKFQDLIFQYLAVVLDKRQGKGWRIVAGDNPTGLALQVAFLIRVGKVSCKDTVDKAFEDGGHTAPPDRKNENQMVCPSNQIAVFCHFRVFV